MRRISCLFVLFSLTLGQSVFAYYMHQNTGDILDKGEYKIGASPQVIVDPDSDFNLSAFADMGLNRDINLRAVLGFGDIFHTGIFANYVPVPDIEGQPAFGVLGGVLVARPGGDLTEFSIRAHPFVSKKFETEVGTFDAYTAIPLGIRFLDGDTDVPIQLTVGTNWLTYNWENLMFNAEIGFDVNDAFTFFTVGVVITLDESRDFEIRPR